MPSTIPYDPSLVLANIVNDKSIKLVTDVSAAQAPADTAQDALNALLSARRSLDMTRTELLNLGIDPGEVVKAVSDLNGEIAAAAADYAKLKISAEKTIKELRKEIQGVNVNFESPVDYVKSEIKSLPLAAPSMSMDVQYFSYDSNSQDSDSYASSISGFISGATDVLGSKASFSISSAAAKQISEQISRHSVAGTLVLSVTCTHRNASVMAPLILNVDKAIKVWNKIFPGDILDPTDRQQMLNLAQSDTKEEGASFNIISGMTYGSSFVGMVHVLKTDSTTAKESMTSIASSVKASADKGMIFAGFAGGFGLDSKFGDDIKSLLSTQNITSHVTLISMGMIPSMVSKEVEIGVKQFSDFDPKKSMEAIALLTNATSADHDEATKAADKARVGQELISMKSGQVKATLSALSDIQDGKNKILDITSMMSALEDYLKKANTADCGVPINYYLKPINKIMLAELWVNKYFPGRYLQIKNDDSADTVAPAAPASAS